MKAFLLFDVKINSTKRIEEKRLEQEILDNYRVQGSAFDIVNGLRDLSKSVFFTALKISIVMAVFSFFLYFRMRNIFFNG